MSWGHDEYLYQVLRHNGCQIPEKGLSIIRFHSFFAWHKEGQYQYFMAPEDEKILKWCKRFSCADLYSKGTLPISKQQIENELEPYYRSLIEKYFPNTILNW